MFVLFASSAGISKKLEQSTLCCCFRMGGTIVTRPFECVNYVYVPQLNPDLSGEAAVVVGQGNVAVDVARILITPTSILQVSNCVW